MNPFEMKKVAELLNGQCLNADAVFIAVLKDDVVYTHEYGKVLKRVKLLSTLKKKLNGFAKPVRK